MNNVSAVLFDRDGVLVDSEGISNRLLCDDLSERGLDLTMDEVMSFSFGGTMEGVAAEAARRGADMPGDWVAQFYRKMFAALDAEVEAVPGVADLLMRLNRGGKACAVASNGPRAKMEVTLKRTGLWDWLDPHIYSARDLAHPKPAPDVYLHAAAQLQVSPQHCVVVEDSPSGARAARAAGMRCIGYQAAGHPQALDSYCDLVISDMAEAITLLGV